MLEAHLWHVASTNDRQTRADCLAEADRAYRVVFELFAGWVAPGESSDAHLAIANYSDTTRRAVVDALDDWRLVRQELRSIANQAASAESSLHSNWFLRTADALKEDPDRIRLRNLMANRDVDGLRALANETEIGDRPPSFNYFLVKALSEIGQTGAAQHWLETARANTPDAFWLGGQCASRILTGESEPVKVGTGFQRASGARLLMARENVRDVRYEAALAQLAWIFRDPFKFNDN